ncbi:hypothetical protein SISSUDRAFT_1125715 [Sistotremastrum suecicum HHB10207 ss-3]|uniref:BTB domain-containing protein n=1 Tax=Sistotremastrum suecicum HHB10207 ss-3 TaxID=1314776 RepID=A0A166H2X6_9AGAM|nr:hypothetical protein SISSUDRAFT_1125715 [Sistotremastrum suecicum HHB10207 ss-3]
MSSTNSETNHPIHRTKFAFADADLVIQTADNQRFKVHKSVMSMFSDVFKDMIALDQVNNRKPNDSDSESGSESKVEHVEITERSYTFRFVLRLTYHLPISTLPSLDQLSDIMVMLDKYQMGRLHESVQNFILANLNLEENPLRYYTLARSYSLTRVKSAVLPHVGVLDLRAYTTNTNLKIPKGLLEISFPDYHKLVFFKNQRSTRILAVVERARLPSPVYVVRCDYPPVRMIQETGPQSTVNPNRCCSWNSYITTAREEVNTANNQDILRPELRVKVAINSKCPNAMRWLLDDCGRIFDEAQRAVKEIPWEYEEEYERVHGVGAQEA